MLEQVVVCDTDPGRPADEARERSRCCRWRGILAETIDNVFRDDSVSAIFKGENQLF